MNKRNNALNSYKQMITWTTPNGPDEESGKEKSIQDR